LVGGYYRNYWVKPRSIISKKKLFGEYQIKHFVGHYLQMPKAAEKIERLQDVLIGHHLKVRSRLNDWVHASMAMETNSNEVTELLDSRDKMIKDGSLTEETDRTVWASLFDKTLSGLNAFLSASDKLAGEIEEAEENYLKDRDEYKETIMTIHNFERTHQTRFKTEAYDFLSKKRRRVEGY